MKIEKLFQIDSGYFTAGGEVDKHNFVTTNIAPIIKYMKGWRLERVQFYCNSKGWKLIVIG